MNRRSGRNEEVTVVKMVLRGLRSDLVGYFEFLLHVILSGPRARPFSALKRAALRACGAKVGKSVVIYPRVWIMTGRNLVLGNHVDLAQGVLITSDGGVTIGDRTLVGYGSRILSQNHRLVEGVRIFDSGHENGPVEIGPDVWLGAGVIVLPGARIGEGAVIGAGAVVVGEIPPHTLAVGVPARVVRSV